MNLKKYTDKYKNHLYLVFRVVVGFLFLSHGGQKLFGWFGGNAVPLVSKMGLAGIIEFFGGLMILFGLFSRLAALIAALEMLYAYFTAHFPSGYLPILNQGELSLLYFAVFLMVLVYGNGKWNLEKYFLKGEIF